MKSRKCDHVQLLLSNLHWLPVRSRIDYKISTLCFNTLTNSSVYIAQLLSIDTPSRHLRSSSDTCTLHILFIKTFVIWSKSNLLHRHNSIEFTALWTPNTLNLLLHLKQFSKPISSDLCTNLLYLLEAVCVCVCVCVCVSVCLCVCVCVCVYVCVCV